MFHKFPMFVKLFSKLLLSLWLMVTATGAMAETYPTYPVLDTSHMNPAQAAQVKRGEYMAKAGDCIACHTKDNDTSAFAGGLGLETPFGAFYSPNITADEETGIGKWSDAQFLDAVRHGNCAKGNCFPVFPFVYFNKMSEADILDIKAYLLAIPKVQRAKVPDQVPWPFNVRLAQYGWKLLFFYPYEGEFKADPKQSLAWNRGAYIVEGPGHCGMCHSPLNPLGAEQRKYRYTGGFIQGYFAPNITAEGLKDFSVDDIVNVFRHDKKPGGGMIQGPMLEVNHDSLMYLNESDQRAIATYLKTLHYPSPPVSHSAITAETGPKIYDKYCSGCHANGGGGAPIFGDKADWQARMQGGFNKVLNSALNGIGGMPSMGNCLTCTSAEIQATVQYMVDSSLKGSTSAKKPVEYYALPMLTMAQGKVAYQQYCAACHTEGQQGAPKIGDVAAWRPILQDDFDDVLRIVVKGQSYDGKVRHPVHGACAKCSTAEVIAATKYLAQQSAGGSADYSLW